MAKKEKKVYKKWWFWLGILFVLISLFGREDEEITKDKDNIDTVIAEGEVVKTEIEEVDKQEEIERLEEKLSELDDIIKDIDFESVIEETKEEFTDSEFFTYVKDVHIEVNEDQNKIIFTAVVGDSTDKDVAVEFADIMIRRFSSNLSTQNSNFKRPGHEYLGGIFDYYNIMIGVAPLSKTDSTSEWYVFDSISKGRHKNPKAK